MQIPATGRSLEVWQIPTETLGVYKLWLKMWKYPASIYVNQQDTQCFMIEFIHNTWWLDMFRTSMAHHQERLQAVCCEFGMW